MTDRATEPTRGPWKATQSEDTDFAHVTDADPAATTGDICTVWGVTGNALANARLIAAAPELLELAKLLERTVAYEIDISKGAGDDEGARMKTLTLLHVCDIIAKAEGKP